MSSKIPVIILSVRDNERDKVAALDHGADDYLTKPFGIEELLARIRVALRHSEQNTSPTQNVIHAGLITIDLSRHLVTRGEEKVHPHSVVIGKPLADLTIPSECVIAAIIRKGKLIIPHGDTLLMAADEIIAVCHESQIKQLAAALA